MRTRFHHFLTALSVGVFLAVREIRRANLWTTLLIIFVMMLTFLNLIVVGGILVGLIQGSTNAVHERYSSDLILSPLSRHAYIEESGRAVALIKGLPEVTAVTARYIEAGRIEADYKKSRRPSDVPESAGGLVAGINPADENRVTGLARFLKEGSYLRSDDYDQVLMGANLFYKYTPIDSPGLSTLRTAGVGSKVRLTVHGFTREVTIKGIIKAKVGELDQRIYMVDAELRTLIGRSDLNVDEIAVKLIPGANPDAVKQKLIAAGLGERAKVQTWSEAQPKFLTDIKDTFALLGNVIGTIGLIVASITIFIVIFVNAITRRRSIGILKGIGINAAAIQCSYMLQAIFYALMGTALGSAVIYVMLVPYFASHPINFPFSDGILVASPAGTTLRALILLAATAIAGFIPARIVVRQNTLDAILGR